MTQEQMIPQPTPDQVRARLVRLAEVARDALPVVTISASELEGAVIAADTLAAILELSTRPAPLTRVSAVRAHAAGLSAEIRTLTPNGTTLRQLAGDSDGELAQMHRDALAIAHQSFRALDHAAKVYDLVHKPSKPAQRDAAMFLAAGEKYATLAAEGASEIGLRAIADAVALATTHPELPLRIPLMLWCL